MFSRQGCQPERKTDDQTKEDKTKTRHPEMVRKQEMKELWAISPLNRGEVEKRGS